MAEVHSDTTFPYPIPARYQCINLLGYGGSGLVYKTYDQRLKRDVAIKFARSPSIVSRHRLVNEARLLSSVSHPALCRVFDIGEPEVSSSSLFIVLEYIEGEPLSKVQRRLSVYEAVELLNSLTEGVCRMHEAGYTHNDIQPHNIMLRSTATHGKAVNQAVLIDLSIATPHSPETVQRDIYQLGSLLLSLLTDMTPEQLFGQPVAQQNSRLPSELRGIIKKALSPDPNSRFHHCQELQNELTRWLQRYRVKRRLFRLGMANAAILMFAVLVFIVLLKPTMKHMPGYSIEHSHYTHAAVFANYSQHLASNGASRQAQEHATLALHYFDEAITDNPDNLKYQTEQADFILSTEGIFTKTQITTKLLNAINKLGEPESYNDESEAHYLRAHLYLGLARFNNEQPHLVKRWANLAIQSATAATSRQPHVDRYQKLHNKIRQYQSNGGTD